MRILFLVSFLFLGACSDLTRVVAMQHPQTNQTIECRTTNSVEYFGRLTEKCVEAHRQMGYVVVFDSTASPIADVAGATRLTQETPSTSSKKTFASVAVSGDRRLALVIGNSEYRQAGQLRNPVNDATDIASELQKLNFRVKLIKNATYRELEESVRQFGQELRQGSMGLFYFAGHGIQVEGENYLIPTDAILNGPADVRHRTVPMNWVLDTMRDAENGLNVIVFDACRNNPFPQGQRSAARGLAPASKVRGALVAYSTSPGEVAEDGRGRNSPYASALIQNIRTPGVAIEQMFKQVRISVDQETNGKQTPWELSSLTGDFYFSSR